MKIKRGLKIVILLLLLFYLNTSVVFANSSIEFTETDTYIDTNQYEQYAASAESESEEDDEEDEETEYDMWDPEQFDPYSNRDGILGTGNPITKILLWVLACLRAVAVGLGIIMIINTGLKYMMTREPETKKMLKMQFPGTILGIALLFGGTAILKLISNLIEDFADVI